MVNRFFRLFLALNATSWVIVIFGIKEEWSFWGLSSWICGIVLFIVPVVLSAASEQLMTKLHKDNLEVCIDVVQANNSFLPTYLGYFFVGLGVESLQTLIFIYILVFVFTFVSQSQYFNPIFLLFGYKFYYVTTEKGTKIFLISREAIRNPNGWNFNNLRRINDVTYIDKGNKKNE